MNNVTPPLSALALLCALALHAAPAHAQLARTFVSAAIGNDANNCDRPTPCRSFQGAHDKTNPDGEITVLDPGGYGAVRITKSISIVNDVGEASVLVSGGATGITINANTFSRINLRGITVQGIGFGGGNGLALLDAASLTIANSVFRNLSGNGITFSPNANNDFNDLSITNTLVADNGGNAVEISPTANTTVNIAMRSVDMVNNGAQGLFLNGGLGLGTMKATVVDSVSANNGGDGFFLHTNAGKMATNLMLLRSVAANNAGTGLTSSNAPNSSLLVAESSITDNAASWSATGGAVLQSFGDNYFARNAAGDPPPPTIAKH
jgi:hypothetical protein